MKVKSNAETGSPWDAKYGGYPQVLEAWFYGKRSLEGATRRWFVEEASTFPEGTRLLDAGCGGGVTGYQLMRAGLLDKLAYDGIDGSEAMLALARSKVVHPRAQFSHADLRLLTGAWDRILLRAVLEHHDDAAPVLAAVLRCLAPEGVLYVIWWNNPVPGEPLVEMTEVGVPDKAHNISSLLAIIDRAECEVCRYVTVDEPAARGERHRCVWAIKRKTP